MTCARVTHYIIMVPILILSAIIILMEYDLFRICQGSDVYLTQRNAKDLPTPCVL